MHIHPAYAKEMLKVGAKGYVTKNSPQEEMIKAIPEREIQIMNFIKQGVSSKEIATYLHISLKTVEVHRHAILKKLKLKNTASLVKFIISW